MKAHGVSNLKVALVWAVAGAFATAAILPYAFALMPALAARVKVPFIILAAAQSLQASILLFVLCWTGLRLGTVAALDSPIVRSALAGERVATHASVGRAAIGVVLGCAMAVIIFAGTAAFAIHMPVPSATLPQITLWKRLLASLYGGVVEEAVFRLFLVSLIAWSLAKLFYGRSATLPRWAAWAAIIGASLLFGIGHLPAAVAVWPLTAVVVLRTVILNSIGGVLFGWLFWRWGFEYAVVAHLSADLVLHGFGSA